MNKIHLLTYVNCEMTIMLFQWFHLWVKYSICILNWPCPIWSWMVIFILMVLKFSLSLLKMELNGKNKPTNKHYGRLRDCGRRKKKSLIFDYLFHHFFLLYFALVPAHYVSCPWEQFCKMFWTGQRDLTWFSVTQMMTNSLCSWNWVLCASLLASRLWVLISLLLSWVL